MKVKLDRTSPPLLSCCTSPLRLFSFDSVKSRGGAKRLFTVCNSVPLIRCKEPFKGSGSFMNVSSIQFICEAGPPLLCCSAPSCCTKCCTVCACEDFRSCLPQPRPCCCWSHGAGTAYEQKPFHERWWIVWLLPPGVPHCSTWNWILLPLELGLNKWK